MTDFPPRSWQPSRRGKVIERVQPRCRPCRRSESREAYYRDYEEGGERIERRRRASRRSRARLEHRDPRSTRGIEERRLRRALIEALAAKREEGVSLTLICKRLGWPPGEHTRLRRTLGLAPWPDGYKMRGIDRGFATKLAAALDVDPREVGL